MRKSEKILHQTAEDALSAPGYYGSISSLPREAQRIRNGHDNPRQGVLISCPVCDKPFLFFHILHDGPDCPAGQKR